MSEPVDLRPDHLALVHQIIGDHLPSAPIKVFGSRARWTAKPYSDLDLIVSVSSPVAPRAAADIEEAFSDSELPFKVDIVYDTGLANDFLEKIAGQALPLPWPTRPLKTFVSEGRSICYGVVQPGASDPGGVPIVRVNNFNGEGLDVDNVLRISSDIEAQYQRSRLKGGELLVTLVGSVGLTAIAPPELAGWNVARAVGVVPIAANADVRWINHVMRSQPVREFMARRSNTTVQTTFNLKDLAAVPIPMPPERIRRSMSDLLSALDDKIELNRRMNETLEASARALFRDWFVDFGPTRAKAEGRPAYLAPDLCYLFPDRLDDDGVPEGWEQRKVSEFAELKGGKQLEKHRIYETGDIPVFGGAGIMGYADDFNSEGYVISVGRVGAYCGQFFAHRGRAWINNNASHVRSLKPRLAEWLFLALRHVDMDVIKKGAAQPFVSNTDIANLDLIWPGKQTIEAFSNLLEPLVHQMECLADESRTLAATRDALLPKLMSGEIRVRDAEALAA